LRAAAAAATETHAGAGEAGQEGRMAGSSQRHMDGWIDPGRPAAREMAIADRGLEAAYDRIERAAADGSIVRWRQLIARHAAGPATRRQWLGY
jgi:hypothetical protein